MRDEERNDPVAGRPDRFGRNIGVALSDMTRGDRVAHLVRQIGESDFAL